MKVVERVLSYGKRGLAVSALVLAIASSGCSVQAPLAGEFPKERVPVAVPHHPVVMLINAGEYHCKRIQAGEELRGIDITKYHWLFGKTGNQQLHAPENAEEVGIRESPGIILEHDFWIGYDLDGKRRVDQHGVSWGGDGSRIKGRFVYDKERESFVRE